MKKASWIVLTVLGAAITVISLVSAVHAYRTSDDYGIGHSRVSRVAGGDAAVATALRGIRGTSAAYGVAYGVLFLAIVGGGFAFLKGVSGGRPVTKIEPEDVAELDVFFVCSECGTEFQVTRLGEMQVPRHCGEPMNVVRRPRPVPENN